MTDRELLELAAKAAGYDKTRTCIDEWFWINTSGDEWEPWNPLTDDGDALRLAVKLNIDIRFYPGSEINDSWVETAADGGDADEMLTPDPYAATRRAIVRAAAEIGKDKT